jgi:uncharacterized protein YwlG (UPF0340 family)
MTMNYLARRPLAQDLCPQSVQRNQAQASSHSLSWWKLLLVAACTSGMGASAQCQNLNLPAGSKPVEMATIDAHDGDMSGDPSTGMVISTPVSVPVTDDKQPEITANPGRPAMATSALLTPVGYAQFESGLLFATDSAGFSNRSGEEETMRVTVTPFLQFIVAAEPIAHTSTEQEDLNQRGDSTAGLQVVMMPGHGVKPTISSSYLHLVRMGTASSLDIGGYANSVLLMASSDLGHLHVDANVFLNETEGPVRRAQLGQAVAFSHPLTAKLGATAELRHFTEPLSGGSVYSTLWAAGYSIRPNLVIDTGLVNGFTGTSTRWQVASGVTYVLPHRLWGSSY